MLTHFIEHFQLYSITGMLGPVLLWIGFASFAAMLLIAISNKGIALRKQLSAICAASGATALYAASVFWNQIHHMFTPEFRLLRLLAGILVVVSVFVVAPYVGSLVEALCLLQAKRDASKKDDAEFAEVSKAARDQILFSLQGNIDPNIGIIFAMKRANSK